MSQLGGATATGSDPARGHSGVAIPVLAIDGTSASGKGTIAARAASALGFHLLDSGALYRLVGLCALRAGVALEDEAKVAALARELPARFAGEAIFLGDTEVSVALRGDLCSDAASRVAVHPAVRAALLQRQRDFLEAPGLVADGRDMGTVVFPDARAKVFLTASLRERAERRYKQLIAKGIAANIDDLLREIEGRDRRDRERAAAPLTVAPDALVIDTTGLSIDAVLAQVLTHFRRAAEGSGGSAGSSAQD